MSSRFFFDANIIGVAGALEPEMSGIVYPGHADWPFDQDASDEIWLPYVGDSGWCAILRDKRVRYRRSERATLERYRVRAVVIATDRNLTIAENADLLRGNWTKIEATLSKPPAFYHLTARGLREVLRY
ncbi:MAG: hypothetical protein WAM81_06155 [Acidimicrobiia bacterium]